MKQKNIFRENMKKYEKHANKTSAYWHDIQ